MEGIVQRLAPEREAGVECLQRRDLLSVAYTPWKA